MTNNEFGKKRKIFVIIILLITCIGKLSSQTIVTDRPYQTESSLTVPVGSFQIECGLVTGLTENENVSERQYLLPTTLLRYGLTGNV